MRPRHGRNHYSKSALNSSDGLQFHPQVKYFEPVFPLVKCEYMHRRLTNKKRFKGYMVGHYALVIGINEYINAPLSWCVSDAQAISEALEMPEYDFSITTLLDSDATRSNIIRHLNELRNENPDCY